MSFQDPDRNCDRCPRLFRFLEQHRVAFPDWHNAPVPSFGELNARLLIVGLAPGLRGANLTGRPFTGDYAGDLLYSTLLEAGFAIGAYDRRSDDGLQLVDCRITNAVRCVPPQNKPNGMEKQACRSFMVDELNAMPRLKIVLALGGLAHGEVLAALGERKSLFKFAHGAQHSLSNGLILIDSYHCSRYNTNTRRLTEAMFRDVVVGIKRQLTRR
mgnify:CR=1 FL=1